MTRGRLLLRTGALAGLIVALPTARGDEPTAWDEGPRRPPPPAAEAPFPRPLLPEPDDADLQPVALEVESSAGLARELAALAEAGRAEDLPRAVRARTVDPLLRARLVRGEGGGAPLLGAQEAARRVLAALPQELLAPARRAWDLELEASGLLARHTEAAARELLVAFPLSSAAAEAARWLGERCLERGELEAALFYFRRALAAGPSPSVARALEARDVGLRARPGAASGPPPAAPPALGLAWARRTSSAPLDAVCHGAGVIAAYPGRLLGLDRRDGRVRWWAETPDDGRGGEEREVRLAVGHDLVLRAGRTALRAFEARGGAPRWALTLEALRAAAGVDDPLDRFVDAAATPDGFVLLVTLGGGRRVMALDVDGAARWTTPLWAARAGEAVTPLQATRVAGHVAGFNSDGRVVALGVGQGGAPGRRATCPAPGPDGLTACGAPLLRGVRCPTCGYDAAPDAPLVRLAPLEERAADRDGKLACLGDRVLLTADGLVVALGLARGELLWALDRASGLGLAGRRIFVSLRAEARAVEAVTATGLVVRLDPLDGALLAPPPAPASLREAPPAPLALAPSPLVLGWPGGGGLVVGAGALGDAARPLGPGLVLGRRSLVVPVADGLLTLDLVTGAVSGRVAWPFAPARPHQRRLASASDGFVVAWGPDGLAAFAPGVTPPGAPGDLTADAPGPDAPIDALIRALDDPDWRRRAAARTAIGARADAVVVLRAALGAPGASPEVREVAGQLLAREERRARWRALAPDAPPAALEPLLDGDLRAPTLAAVGPHVAVGPQVAAGLIDLLEEASDEGGRAALIDLALHAHEPLCGRVVAIIRNAQANLSLSLAAAEYLVDLARRGLDTPVRRALVHPDELTRATVQAALLMSQDKELWSRLRPDPAYWEELTASPILQALGPQLVGVAPDHALLIDELTRALLSE